MNSSPLTSQEPFVNAALADRVIATANALIGPESKGFKRYMALPCKVASNMKTAHYLAGKPDSHFTQTVAHFLGSMSEDEYRRWLILHL